MPAGLAHLEVLGPRAGLDAWLATLQDAGTCHLADALQGLAGEPGIGRPAPREEERRAADLRAPALVALRSIAPLLPGARTPDAGDDPGAWEWSLRPGGVGEDALAVRTERALGLVQRIRRDLADPQALAARLAGDGVEARRALDALDDAEARDQARWLLASTGHVVAARVFVPEALERDLRQRLERKHGAAVVVRRLDPAPDAPTPARGPVGAGPRVVALLVLLAALAAALLLVDPLLGLLLVPGAAAAWALGAWRADTLENARAATAFRSFARVRAHGRAGPGAR